MISLSSEMTDAKGRRAPQGWVLFDRDCRICTSLVRRLRQTFEKRGFGLAALQDPRVAVLLGLPPDQLLREMRVVTTKNEMYGGAEAIVYLAKQIWWGWPVYVAAKLPGVLRILKAGYRWFADHRRCSASKCSIAQNHRHNDLNKHAKGEPQ
jgi:predicted DCC family thiol-disulfide oxidoreductase YuxK